ncbi:hypothetical protein SOVF_098850 [Spinacia oleracea]|uniref:UDP-glycosyltransferase 89A2 n=1 Tax=Spinacia oleracea TaxID=3562 RepID=A0A9R0I6X2_SPIOL|nr:UDP-glycosyltransferase 89A2-like [Spinacia oleracea]KNA15373.1 hypothetical protein SOVF_098850 [Spinacia oleracea]
MATTATEDATAAAATTTHILVFPYPAQGHMPALLDLTHQLALRGLKITILITPKNLPALTTLLSTHSTSIDTLVLPFPPHPKLPPGVENIKDIGNSGNAPVTASLSKLEGEVIQWFQAHPSPPQAILSDFFLGCTQQWATHLNIPRIAFFSVAALLTSILTHLWQHLDKLHSSDIIEFPGLPLSPSFPQHHLPSIFRNFRDGDPDWEIVKEGMLANSKSWGYVYNSFYALEGEYLDNIQKELGHHRVYNVGPLSLIGLSKSSDTKYEVLNWLDTCPDGSVLYVCFGSQKLLTEPQIRALALGLERSKTRFIWVVKSVSSQQVPDGFDERVSDRGMVLRGWAPQVEILHHKAVGGFVSHCGWNSLLESVTAGVMLLAWPMEADQFINAKLLVEYTGLAVKLCQGEHTVPDSDALARIIYESLGQDIPQKARAKAMSNKALEAVKAGGSSAAALDELVKELTQLGVPKT